MLNITPKEILAFPDSMNSEASINLYCNSVVPILYKIQTTSPEKFRVRPRHGLLEPRQSLTINILLRPEHRLNESTKDKFLVMGMPAPMDRDLSSVQTIADIWKLKNDSSPIVEQHRLSCIYENLEFQDEGFRTPLGINDLELNNFGKSDTSSPRLSNQSTGDVDQLTKHTQKLEKQLKFTQFMQYFTLIILLLMSIAVVYLLRLEMNLNFLPQSPKTSKAAPYLAKSVPLHTRISNSLPKMSRLTRGSK